MTLRVASLGEDPAIERHYNEGKPVLEHVLRWMVRRLGHVVPIEDMRASAQEGLLEAARTFDPARASLPTYVARKVRWAILDGIKRERRFRRALARATALLCAERLSIGLASTSDDAGFSEDDHVSALDRLLEAHAVALALGLVSGASTPEEHISRAEMAHALRRAIDALPERERKLVERHYFQGEDFDEIAADLGISKSWASRLHTQAIQSLATAIAARTR
ncbi:sigma-70 family RNA polymerase sigma factor [Polyangium sorediatum]|uniref:Sigma-70 family RNA polymerase sigma factor n=1 Tax=Polyangium sorediatum TaxID=889274 RepID=A0ABT6NW78_9BACT|nr:sigma-70 family RNA polymerase sigma factor [Polyangium sorediatum]MDI1432592.1 sigma-70 family RNA polymerase sigma factor [Polyangium sorediatum]